MKYLALLSVLLLSTQALAKPPPRNGKTLGYEHLRRPAPEVGTEAPDFELQLLGTDEQVRLSSYFGDRPVALVFGSYT